MPQPVKAAPRPPLTAEEKAAAKAARVDTKLRRDRVRMLDGVQTMLRHAAAALATGEVESHNEYLTAAESQLDAYKRFVALSSAKPNDTAE